MKFIHLALFLGAAALLRVRPAVAQTGSAASPAARKAEADRLFSQGMTALAAKDHAEARAKFAAGYAKYPAPAALFNLAYAEKEQGLTLEAIQHYRSFLGLPDTDITTQGRPRAQQELDDCLTRVCQLEIHAPAEATVDLEGAPAPLRGRVLEVLPGTHRLATRGVSAPVTRTVSCSAGRTVVVDLTGQPTQPPSAPPMAAPIAPSRTRPAAGWIVPGALVASGLLGLGLGIGLGSASSSATADAETGLAAGACAQPSSATCQGVIDSKDRASGQRTASAAFYVGGALLGAAGVVSFLVWPTGPRSPRSALRVTPTLGGFVLTHPF